jgi:2-dehydropantoate 2-reductase
MADREKSEMRILVLGAGALGGYFGGRLLEGGADVYFLVRPRRAGQLKARGLVVKTQDGEIRRPVRTIQAGELKADYDAVLLSCKAYDLDTAMQAIGPAVTGDCFVAPVLNGVRHIDRLSERFGARHVFGGLTAVNAALTPEGDIVQSPVRVDMTGFGELDGTVSPRVLAFQAAFAAGGMKADASASIMVSMWTKFFAFGSIATIATLMRSRAGAFARTAGAAALMESVFAEVSSVAAAEGYPPPDAMRAAVRGLYSQSDSNYGPSMLVDVENGAPTEGEHIIGDLVERADKHGLAVPILKAARINLQVYETQRTAK